MGGAVVVASSGANRSQMYEGRVTFAGELQLWRQAATKFMYIAKTAVLLVASATYRSTSG